IGNECINTGRSVVVGRVANERAKSNSRVKVASGIARQRCDTSSRILGAGGVASERSKTNGRIVVAVARQRGPTHSSVVVSTGIGLHRVTADRCVAATADIIKQGKGAVSGVVAAADVADERTDASGRVAASGGVVK